jgi:hypothetical protein
MARARLAVALAVLAAALWLLVGRGLVNYDTLYALVWGRDLGHGELPDYDVPVAPTPHPLSNLAGLVVSPLSARARDGVHGEAAVAVTLVAAFLLLALLGWLVYRLGAAWFNPAVGMLAAAILLTRRPVLDFGARAYVDIPYLVLVLAALLVETRRPRAGAPVLALLALAGLIRPEAWLFAGVYWLYVWWAARPARAALVGLAALVAAAPVVWLLADWAVTGDPLHSLTGTQSNVESLGRITGLANVPVTAPRRIGEILREPVLLAAAGGGVMSLLWLGRRAWLGAAVGVLAMAAFCGLAAAGLPILGRYLLLPAAILAVFAGAGVFGWAVLARDDRRRVWWARFGALCLVALAVFVPPQVDRIRDLRHALAVQDGIQDDLRSLVRRGAFGPPCRTITVPNHRPVPLLALWLDIPPRRISSALQRRPVVGVYVRPATPAVARDYVLDPRDRVQVLPAAPKGFNAVGGNRSWLLYKRCAPDVVAEQTE